jgi:hypothetical protein
MEAQTGRGLSGLWFVFNGMQTKQPKIYASGSIGAVPVVRRWAVTDVTIVSLNTENMHYWV